jgi:ribosomal protein S18 acetylase RimI-like enzyme
LPNVQKIEVIAAELDNPDHQRGIRELIGGYAREPIGNGEPLAQDVLDRLIPGLQRHPGSRVFLAVDGELAVGVAVCFVGFSTFAGRPLLNIHDLAVAASHRNRGIGRLLLDRVEAEARELGCCKLTLEVRSDNDAALGLYRSFGFGDLGYGSGEGPVFFQTKHL